MADKKETASDDMKMKNMEAEETKETVSAVDTEPEANEEMNEAEETDETPATEEGVSEATSQGEETPEGKPEEGKSKSKLFGKNEKKETAKLKEQIDELNDRVVRQMAEFDNYRKRTDKEKQQMFETGAKSVIEKILPVVDNFERGLATIPEEEKGSAFAEGMSMIYKQLMSELEKMEVKAIEAVGKEFDPNLHNAVMHIDDEAYGENEIVDELQKGYMYRDTVVRHSMVRVAN
ncbi:MAG: nucleotide exchange factor GrpE [Lachnospiraceae bacterium]